MEAMQAMNNSHSIIIAIGIKVTESQSYRDCAKCLELYIFCPVRSELFSCGP